MTDGERSQEAEDVARLIATAIEEIRGAFRARYRTTDLIGRHVGPVVMTPILARLVREGQIRLLTACETFIRDRGHHDDEHVIADYRPCSKCEEAYIRAEAAFDSVVSETRAALKQEG